METRICANIRSKRFPHSRCTLVANHGEYCSRHWKNPRRWIPSPTLSPLRTPEISIPSIRSPRVLRKQNSAASKIQRFWRTQGTPKLARRHGPCYFVPKLSANTKEICTMDSIETIPRIYRISYIDSQHHAWSFDIRFLIQSMTYESSLKNPFTQTPYTPSFLLKLEALVEWLKVRKFPIVYVDKDILTPDQLWNQKVLSVLLKYHSLGYTLQPRWFEELTKYQHLALYQRLFLQWYFGPIAQERGNIVPGWDNPLNRLFRWPVEYAATLDFKTIHWWRKMTLTLLDAFVSGAEEKSIRTSGALFVMMGLVHVSPAAAESYSYLL